MPEYCRNLLGLYCIYIYDIGGNIYQDRYVISFSFNIDTLKKIKSNILCEKNIVHSIEPVKLYSFKMSDRIFCSEDNTLYDHITLPIHGFYYLNSSGTYEQILLSTDVQSDISNTYLNHNDISLHPIYIDTLYEESILNA